MQPQQMYPNMNGQPVFNPMAPMAPSMQMGQPMYGMAPSVQMQVPQGMNNFSPMAPGGYTAPYMGRQQQQRPINPYSQPPPENVPLHSMPPAFRNKILEQQQQQQQQQQFPMQQQYPMQQQQMPMQQQQFPMQQQFPQYPQQFPMQQQQPQMQNFPMQQQNFPMQQQNFPMQQQVPMQMQQIPAQQQQNQQFFQPQGQNFQQVGQNFQPIPQQQMQQPFGQGQNFQPQGQMQQPFGQGQTQHPQGQGQVLSQPWSPNQQQPVQSQGQFQGQGQGQGGQGQQIQAQSNYLFSSTDQSITPGFQVAHGTSQTDLINQMTKATVELPPQAVEVLKHAERSKQGDLAIGIDLGTTYSCVGVYRNKQVEILANEFGSRTTPSCVAFTDAGEILVGESAVNQAAGNASRTIFDVKRLMGRKFTDDVVKNDMEKWPFKVVSLENGNAAIDINGRSYTPEEISAMILSKMKQIAETSLGRKVTRAVITVPAYFNDGQRQATIDAAKIAGLEVLRIINEPTAASLAYGLDKTKNPSTNVLVFDLGGGTFDVSILQLSHGLFKVKAVGGDTHLGGEDFDNNLVDFVLNQTDFVNDVKDISAKSMRLLRTACEKAKRVLSSSLTTQVIVDNFHNGRDLKCDVRRTDFELVNDALFRKCLDCVRDTLLTINMDRREITETVFVGGSTRIPRIQEMVTGYFQKEPNKSINPDESVAYGAAIQASILAQHEGHVGDQVLLYDVAPLSLGVEVHGGAMKVMIPRNHQIPCSKSEIFSTHVDNQESVLVTIFEGERPLVENNNKLGDFFLHNIEKNRAGVPKIEVTFQIDVNGVLHVSAMDKASQNQQFVSIKSETGRLSKAQIEALVHEAELNRENDQKKLMKLEASTDFERFLMQLRQTMVSQEVMEKVPADQRQQIDMMITQNLDWLRGPGLAASAEQILDLKKKIEEAVSPILGRLYHQTGQMPGQNDSRIGLVGVEGIGSSAGTQSEGTDHTHIQMPNIQAPNIQALGPPYNVAQAPPQGQFNMPLPPPVQTNIPGPSSSQPMQVAQIPFAVQGSFQGQGQQQPLFQGSSQGQGQNFQNQNLQQQQQRFIQQTAMSNPTNWQQQQQQQPVFYQRQ
jgi:L1 cell adhesion molecule like protein